MIRVKILFVIGSDKGITAKLMRTSSTTARKGKERILFYVISFPVQLSRMEGESYSRITSPISLAPDPHVVNSSAQVRR